MTIRNKIKFFIAGAITMLGVVAIILLFCIIFMNSNTDESPDSNLTSATDVATAPSEVVNEKIEKYYLFGDALETANDLLGKDISTILNGYVENTDYTVATTENCTTYTFPFRSFEIGSDPKLALYVDGSSEITKVQYEFRMDISDSISATVYGHKITDYYDVDSVRTYLDNIGRHIPYSDDHSDANKKTTFYRTWESSIGKVVYSFTNLYEEKKEYGKLTFTKN